MIFYLVDPFPFLYNIVAYHTTFATINVIFLYLFSLILCDLVFFRALNKMYPKTRGPLTQICSQVFRYFAVVCLGYWWDLSTYAVADRDVVTYLQKFQPCMETDSWFYSQLSRAFGSLRLRVDYELSYYLSLSLSLWWSVSFHYFILVIPKNRGRLNSFSVFLSFQSLL